MTLSWISSSTCEAPEGRNKPSTARVYLQQIEKDLNGAGDAKVKFLEFDVQNGKRDGLGSDWHPSANTHQLMAAKFIEAIQRDMKWEPKTAK